MDRDWLIVMALGLAGVVFLIMRRDPTRVDTTDEVVDKELKKRGGE